MKAFIPPKYRETTYLFFEKKTGKVLATEVRCSLQDNSKNKQFKQSSLIEAISKNFKIRVEELGSLVLEDAQASIPQIDRINIKTGKPIFKKKYNEKMQGIFPLQFPTP